jgi:hypothetical protein
MHILTSPLVAERDDAIKRRASAADVMTSGEACVLDGPKERPPAT